MLLSVVVEVVMFVCLFVVDVVCLFVGWLLFVCCCGCVVLCTLLDL